MKWISTSKKLPPPAKVLGATAAATEGARKTAQDHAASANTEGPSVLKALLQTLVIGWQLLLYAFLMGAVVDITSKATTAEKSIAMVLLFAVPVALFYQIKSYD